ncbi:MAG TPA: redoxin domain-containing protein [Fimbriimonadaceae bacterium]|jgi:peroxiredoxin
MELQIVRRLFGLQILIDLKRAPKMKNLTLACTLALSLVSLSALARQGPKIGQTAPEFIGHDWRNSQPLTLSELKGKVVVVHFWTLGCINCKHNLPSYNAWEKEFSKEGVVIVGIHTPESDYERSSRNLDQAIQERKITYPVLVDNGGKNWNAWRQEYWPAVYLVDKQGRIRDSWQGELDFENAGGTAKFTAEIKELLTEKS